MAFAAAAAPIGTRAQSAAPPAQAGAPTAQAAAPPAAGPSPIDEAIAAESRYQFDVAMDRLYTIVLEHPGSPETIPARLRLARLLALAGDLPAAALECQALRDEAAPDRPERQAALDLATTVVRRLRTTTPAGNLFPTVDLVNARGLPALDEPTAIVPEPAGSFLLVDGDSHRVYRVGADSAGLVPGPQEPGAVAVLPDGSVVIAGKTGLMAGGKPLAVTAAWGGKAREVRKVRAMASNSRGDLFVVDRDFDGLLRCKSDTHACAPWGGLNKLQTVKVGPSDYVFVVDEKQQGLRVLDDTGRQVAILGQMSLNTKLEKVTDIAVDGAYGVYLLDADQRRVSIGAMRAEGGQVRIDPLGSIAVPIDGPRAVKDPTAIAVLANGTLLVAGKSTSHVLRFR